MNTFSLGRTLKSIQIEVERKANQDYQRWNLTNSQFPILYYIMENKGKSLTQRDIEQAFHLKNPTVTGLLNLLEQKGFVQRVVNPNDRRSNHLLLTDAGKKLQPVLRNAIRQVDMHLLEGFTEEEITLLENMLERILAHAQNDQSTPSR